MATEKFFVHKEDGSLVRIKGRLVRFLDNEAPTGSDKSAIRTSLEVSPDAEGLVQADVGTDPNEIPVNGMLGDLAYQSSEAVSAGTVSAETLEVESTTGTATTQALTVTDGTDTNFVVQEDGQTVVGGTVSSVAKFGSSAKGLTVRSDTSSVLALNDTDNANYVGYFAQNGTNTYLANYTAGNLYLGTNATTRVTIDSSGDIDVNTGDITQRESATIYNKLDTDSSGLNITVNAGQANVTRNLIFKSSVSGGGVAERLRITSSALVLGSGMAIDFGSGASTTLDAYEEGSVTATDQSGAGLTLALDSGTYIKVGGKVTVWVAAQYPTTSDTSFASIGSLPIAFGSSTSDRVGGIVAYTTYASHLTVLGVNGTGRVVFYKPGGTKATNADLSGQHVYFTVTYDVS